MKLCDSLHKLDGRPYIICIHPLSSFWSILEKSNTLILLSLCCVLCNDSKGSYDVHQPGRRAQHRLQQTLKVDWKTNSCSVSIVETTKDQTDDKSLHSSRWNRSTGAAQLTWRGETTRDHPLNVRTHHQIRLDENTEIMYRSRWRHLC
jgi:hypothetical protein